MAEYTSYHALNSDEPDLKFLAGWLREGKGCRSIDPYTKPSGWVANNKNTQVRCGLMASSGNGLVGMAEGFGATEIEAERAALQHLAEDLGYVANDPRGGNGDTAITPTPRVLNYTDAQVHTCARCVALVVIGPNHPLRCGAGGGCPNSDRDGAGWICPRCYNEGHMPTCQGCRAAHCPEPCARERLHICPACGRSLCRVCLTASQIARGLCATCTASRLPPVLEPELYYHQGPRESNGA